MPTHHYFEKFRNLVEMMEANGTLVGEDPQLVEAVMRRTNPAANMNNCTMSLYNSARRIARTEYLAVAFILGRPRLGRV